MHTRIQYNSPRHHNLLIANSRPISEFSDRPDITPRKSYKNPEAAKPFQRRQNFRALERKKSLQSQEKRRLEKDSEFKAGILKGSEYFPGHFQKPPERIIRNPTSRDRRAGTEIFRSLDCLPSICTSSNVNLQAPRQHHPEEQLNLVKQFNESLMKKNSILTETNITLKQQNEELRCRVEILQEKGKLMQEEIKEYANKQNKNMEDIKQQKSINRCLEDIILQLNSRIQSLMTEPDNVTEETCDEVGHLGAVQKQNSGLKEELLSLNKKISYFELEVTMLKRQKFEVQREKNMREKLQNQNKMLNRKLEDLQKAKRKVKSPNKPKTSDLDYSVSFDFQR